MFIGIKRSNTRCLSRNFFYKETSEFQKQKNMKVYAMYKLKQYRATSWKKMQFDLKNKKNFLKTFRIMAIIKEVKMI